MELRQRHQRRGKQAAILLVAMVIAGPVTAQTPAPPPPAGSQMPAIAILPQPASLTQQPGSFPLKRDTAIVTDVDTQGAGQLLAQALSTATKFGLRPRSGTSAPDKNAIVITTDRSRT